MIQALISEPKTIKINESNMPEPGKNEVLVKLSMTGICGSDVHLFNKGREANNLLVAGHEGIGFIEKTGEEVSSQRKGERVVIEPNIPCRICTECISGRSHVCRNKRIIGVSEHGCFAEYVVVPAEFAHFLPSSISNEDAVTIEPVTVAYSALMRSGAKPGDTILVIGLGAIGLLVAHVALALGYRVFVSDPVKDKVRQTIKQGAIDINNDASEMMGSSELKKICEEENIYTIFECAGSEKTATIAIQSAPHGAEVVLLGLSAKPATFIPFDTCKTGVRINFSLIYEHPFDFKRVIQLINSEKIAPGFIITNYFPLKDLQAALELASTGKESKIVIRIN